ncbi:MAG: PIG-L family deacetylase [Bacteroidetes bacterium]|nr:PIG-L family deacetylase [Bacteroidota bacterium]
MDQLTKKTIALIVAHPDDETLWAGGTILSHPLWQCYIVCLCRGSDTNRAPKFYKTLEILKTEGVMGDLDDGPQQNPLGENEVEENILNLLPQKHYDLIITHNPSGEYTKHLRHEEISKAVITLWKEGKIAANELWTFAYEDGNKAYYPKAIERASLFQILAEPIWLRKYSLITDIYEYPKNGWEEETTPKAEAFWQFTDPDEAVKWLNDKGVLK